MTSLPTLEPGAPFAGRYQIVRKLGAGGFGAVYLAFQPAMDRHVGIKILAFDQAVDPLQQATAKERFLREARIVSKLKHPNSVTIHDFGQTSQGQMFMVLEYIDGLTLQKALQAQGAFDTHRALDVATQIADALAEAHDMGIVHRDLKPGNIMLSTLGHRKDYVKVLDFGIAHLLGPNQRSDLTQAGFSEDERAIIGTPRYMSPEQIHGMQQLTPASDIYSLGLLFYEMLAGTPAIQATSTIQIIAQQASPTPLNLHAMDSLPPYIQSILGSMLQKNPAARFQTCTQVIAALGSSQQAFRYSDSFSALAPSPSPGIALPHPAEPFILSDNAPPAAIPTAAPPLAAAAARTTSTSDHTQPSLPLPVIAPPLQELTQEPARSIEFEFSQTAPPLTLQEDPLARAKALGDHAPAVGMPHAPSAASLKMAELFWLLLVASAFLATLAVASLAVGYFFATKTQEIPSRILYTAGVLAAALLLPFLISMSNRERFKVVSSLFFRLRKTFLGAAVINMLLVMAVVAAGPRDFVHFLESNPNWFSDRVETISEKGVHATNRLMALQIAQGLRQVIGYDVAKDNEAVPTPRPTRKPTDPPDDLPPILMGTDPVPQRKLHPGLEKMLKKSRKKPGKSQSADDKETAPSGAYRQW